MSVLPGRPGTADLASTNSLRGWLMLKKNCRPTCCPAPTRTSVPETRYGSAWISQSLRKLTARLPPARPVLRTVGAECQQSTGFRSDKYRGTFQGGGLQDCDGQGRSQAELLRLVPRESLQVSPPPSACYRLCDATSQSALLIYALGIRETRLQNANAARTLSYFE